MTQRNQEIVRIIDWHDEVPIVLFTELTEPDNETIQKSWSRAQEMTQNKPFHIVAYISHVKPPSAEVRFAIKKEYMKFKPQILSTQMYTGETFLLKIAL